MRINHSIKKFLRKFGLEVGRYNPSTSNTAQLIASLHHFNIDLVLDVGANEGQFSIELRENGYKGKIVSFEPLSMAHNHLCRVSDNDSNWDVYPRSALGAYRHQAEINIASNSASSSLLPMLDAHIEAAPHAAYFSKELVEVFTLDEAMLQIPYAEANIFLKIDTQGFEWEVLDGAIETLPKVRGALLELSFLPLYEGQKLWSDILLRMEQAGFVLWALQPGFVNSKTGRTLQMDGLFFREGI